jgi:hypothetical protein
MKILIFISLSIYFLFSNLSFIAEPLVFIAEPLVLNDSRDNPIKFVWDELPGVIGKSTEIKLKYVWRYWSKSEFEEKQNANGKIKYTCQIAKFIGGQHAFGAKVKYDIEEEGDFNFRASSVIGDNGSYGTGKGRIMVYFFCSYKGKDGKRHKGRIGAMQINATFEAPR